MRTSGNEFRIWVTIITVAAPVISAIVVAVISQRTNVRLAELEGAAKTATIEIEQSKLREQQDTRRQQFMEHHLPQLLSTDESEQRLGKALLFVTYPNNAPDVLQVALPAVSDAVKILLEPVQQEAQAVKKATGDWAIVISGDKTFDLAKKWVAGAQRLGYTPVSIYYRDGFYRVTVGNYPTRQLAEQAAVAIRPQTRPDAYIVALGRWCPSPNTRKEGDGEITVCGSA